MNSESMFYSFFLKLFYVCILFLQILNQSFAFDLNDNDHISVNGNLLIINQQSLKKFQDFNQNEFNSRVDLEIGYDLNFFKQF